MALEVAMATTVAKEAGRSTRKWKRLATAQRAKGLDCWLCGLPIDYTLDINDGEAFTVDHARPLSEHPELAEDATNLRSAHRSCNAQRGNGAPMAAAHKAVGGPSVVDATEVAIEAASHLSEMDEGALAAVRQLAARLDALAAGRIGFDNTAAGTYLKYCDALGLTPAGRDRMGGKKDGSNGGTLAKLRAVHGGKGA